MSQEEWRDARLKKALDSAPDADARPADAVREAILHKARLTAGAAAQPAARRDRRAWRWLGGLAGVGALAVVLIGGRQLFQTNQGSHEEAVPQVAMAPAPAPEPEAKVAEAAASPPTIVVADASPPPSRKAAVQVKKPVVVAAAPPPPPTVVAQATSPPPAAAAAPAVPADAAWTVLRIATPDGPVLLRREQLSGEAAGRLNRLLAAAETEQLRTQLADERQTSGAARSFARAPAPPGLLRVELLRGDQSIGSLVLPPGDPLRQEIEAAAKPASAP